MINETLSAWARPFDGFVVAGSSAPAKHLTDSLPADLPLHTLIPGDGILPEGFAGLSAGDQKRWIARQLWRKGIHRPLLIGADDGVTALLAASPEVIRIAYGAPVDAPAPGDLGWGPGEPFPAERLERLVNARSAARPRVLLLYSENSTHIGAVVDHLQSFREYSRAEILFMPATNYVPCTVDLGCFQAVTVHFSVRQCVPDYFSPAIREALTSYLGPKILFIQDEYDRTETARKTMEEVGYQTVFTCVPDEFVEQVYPHSRFPGVRFVNNFTGYVAEDAKYLAPQTPLAERPVVVGYRGRTLPYWYGALGREKVEIAEKMKAACAERGVACDIEWTDDKRIYGADWPRFIASCRAMLATESGANVFDFDGSIRANIERMTRSNSNFTYDEARKYFDDVDGRIKMNQISPRIFETIAMRTALVLYEGSYSGVVRPDVHYISLKKDFSNIDEVLAKLNDLGSLEAMTRRAYDDVILSGKYSYRAFIQAYDAELTRLTPLGRPSRPIMAMVGQRDKEAAKMLAAPISNRHLPATELYSSRRDGPARDDGSVAPRYRETIRRRLEGSLEGIGIKKAFKVLPPSLQHGIRPLIRWIRKKF